MCRTISRTCPVALLAVHLLNPSMALSQEVRYNIDHAEFVCLTKNIDHYESKASGNVIILVLPGGGKCPEAFSLDDTLLAEGPRQYKIGSTSKDNIIYISLRQLRCVTSFPIAETSPKYTVVLTANGCRVEVS